MGTEHRTEGNDLVSGGSAAERKRRWTEYRQQMLDEAGTVVFLFGNKRNAAGAIVSADGVEEEFSVAVKKDIAVVPVGCTGWVATALHKRVAKNFVKYYSKPGYKKLFTDLGEKSSPTTVAARVLKLVKKLRDEA